jgi:hypothetical protein
MSINEAVMSRDVECPENRLWLAVLARTVEEWVSGPLRLQRMAEDFLFNNQADYLTVCECAGLDPDGFRQKLMRLKSRRDSGHLVSNN